MDSLRLLPPLVNFAVILLIVGRTLNVQCFNATDVNLSIGALIFSVIVEIVIIKQGK